jgi:hypothetical protein
MLAAADLHPPLQWPPGACAILDAVLSMLSDHSIKKNRK